ncbi:MAG: poly(U)-specific 3'-to-5' RNA exonuclease [Bogoriella megaspora]|nr:MAG: poly(U)-specific 3'-to-5' RNA exonuclease [Bogoriella megaspora]
MPPIKLVEYSDSNSDDDTASLQGKKRKRDNESPGLPTKQSSEKAELLSEPASKLPPPLPPGFYDLYASNSRVSAQDDPSLHGGRKRITPHVEGNWPSHVYLECKYALPGVVPSRRYLISAVIRLIYVCATEISLSECQLTGRGHPSIEESQHISNILSRLRPDSLGTDASFERSSSLHPLHLTTLSSPAPLHISLSAPLILRTETKDAFLAAITTALESSLVPCFAVRFTNFDWASNDDRSRWFLVLRCEERVEMKHLLECSNEVAARFGQRELYTAPRDRANSLRKNGRRNNAKDLSDKIIGGEGENEENIAPFHVSIAWSLEAPAANLYSTEDSLYLNELMKEVGEWRIVFRSVKVKIGSVIHDVPLNPRTAIEKKGGILGHGA